MKAAEVHKIIRDAWGPWFRLQGYKRLKSGIAGWFHPVDSMYTTLWVQIDWHGWDPYAGSQFAVNLQLSLKPETWTGMLNRRLPQILTEDQPKLLTDEQLEEVRLMQNHVIAKLRRPPPDYYVLHIDDDVNEWYLGNFEPITEPYKHSDDVWFRYGDEEDVRMWAGFVLAILPTALPNFEAWALYRLATHGADCG